MKVPYFRAKSLEGELVKGFYVELPETTYAFKEDYDSAPVSLIPFLVGYRMTDWGLPNRLVAVRIEKSSLEQVGFVETGIEYFKQKEWVKEVGINEESR